MKSSRQVTALRLWLLLPHALVWLGLGIMCVIFSYGSLFHDITPALPLMIALVLAWEQPPFSLHASLLSCGLIYDILAGMPMGMSAVIWFMVYFYYQRRRHVASRDAVTFFHRWLSITATVAVYLLAESVVVSLMRMTLATPDYAVLRWLFMVWLIPSVMWCVAWCRRRLYRKLWVFLPSEIKPV